MLFLRAEKYLCHEGLKRIADQAAKRLPGAFAPYLQRTRLADREGNTVYVTVVAKD